MFDEVIVWFSLYEMINYTLTISTNKIQCALSNIIFHVSKYNQTIVIPKCQQLFHLCTLQTKQHN